MGAGYCIVWRTPTPGGCGGGGGSEATKKLCTQNRSPISGPEKISFIPPPPRGTNPNLRKKSPDAGGWMGWLRLAKAPNDPPPPEGTLGYCTCAQMVSSGTSGK